MRFRVVLIASAMSLLASASFADDTAVPAIPAAPAANATAPTDAAPATAADVAPADPANEIVCKNIATSGSRLQSTRVCMTRAEWKKQGH